MLEYQLQTAPFRFGVDEGTDPKQVPFGTLLTAQNVVWLKSGRLEKRCGTTKLTQNISGGGTITACNRLLTRGDELCLISDTNLYSYQASGWIDRGRIPEVGLTWTTSHAALSGTTASDLAVTSDDKIIEAWVTGDPSTVLSGNLYYRIVDRATGTVLTPPTLVDTGIASFIRVLASGTNWVILWTNLATGNLGCWTSAGFTTLDTTTAANSTARPALDAYVQGTDFVVAYSLEAGGIRLGRYSFGATPVAAATGSVTGESSKNISSIGIHGAAGETLYIGYADIVTNHRVRFAAANPSTLVQTVAPSNVSVPADLNSATVTLWRASSTTCKFVYQTTTSANVIRISTATITNAGSVTAGTNIHGLMPLTKPFLIDGRFYIGMATRPQSYAATIDALSDSFLVDITSQPFRQVGKVDVYIGNYWPSVGFVAGVAGVSSTKFLTHYPFLTSVEIGKVDITSVRLVEMTIGDDRPTDMWKSVPVFTDIALGAGMLCTYDGAEVVGYSWPYASEVDGGTSVSGVGGNIAAGNYLYNVTSERRSATGILHRGPIGIDRTETSAAATSSITVSILPVSLGAAQYSRGSHLIYRSVVSGTIVQRRAIPPSSMTIEETGGGAYPSTIVDTKNDTNLGSFGGFTLTLAERPYLYTQGGELEDIQPPSAITLTSYRNRIAMVAGDRRTVWLSKNSSAVPEVAPGFNPALRFLFSEDLVGLQVMDERLFFFTENSIFYVSGDGPALDGTGSDYGEPNKLQTDVGCTNARGLVSTPMGIMLVHDNEIHLLDRKLNLQWIGKPVKDLLDTYPVVTSAVLVESKNHVRFSFNNEAGSAGIVVVYDYQESQWSHFVYAGGVSIADACIWNDVYTFVTTGGVVYTEDDTTWKDDGSWVTALIETAWQHAGGPLAFNVVRNFRIDGVSAGAHGLSISVGFNGDTSYAQGPKPFAAGVSGVTSPGPIETANVTIGTRRKCRSIRFKVQDSDPGGVTTGRSVQWSTMGVEVGVKSGFGKLAARQKG